MKRLISATWIMLAVFMSAHAQKASQNPIKRAEQISEWMGANLKLTEEQLAKVKPINLAYAQKNQGVIDSPLPRKQKLQYLRSNDFAKDEELSKILTPDQLRMYKAKKETVKQQLRNRINSKA